MILFSEINCLPNFMASTKNTVVVLNFSSLSSQFPILDILPRQRFDIDDSQQFDMAFANYILNNDYRFCQFFSIIIQLYYGNDVVVLIRQSEFYDILNESLMKLIQQRYGYIINAVNTIEDLEDLVESSFSIQGLYNLDQDLKRYLSITIKE